MLCTALIKGKSKKNVWRRERSSTATRHGMVGWNLQPEVVLQPTFRSSPPGLTEPMTIHPQPFSMYYPHSHLIFWCLAFWDDEKGDREAVISRERIKLEWRVFNSLLQQHEKAGLSSHTHTYMYSVIYDPFVIIPLLYLLHITSVLVLAILRSSSHT